MRNQKPPRRQIFVLTPDEKKAVCCVLGALVLGLVTMHYRAAHPRPAPPPAAAVNEEKAAASPATKKRKPAERRHTPQPQAPAPDREEDEE